MAVKHTTQETKTKSLKEDNNNVGLNFFCFKSGFPHSNLYAVFHFIVVILVLMKACASHFYLDFDVVNVFYGCLTWPSLVFFFLTVLQPHVLFGR